MAAIETDAAPRETSMRPLIAAGALVAFGAAGLLWWRFGETVYASSLMSAILACF
jgi:hypothetical protein